MMTNMRIHCSEGRTCNSHAIGNYVCSCVNCTDDKFMALIPTSRAVSDILLWTAAWSVFDGTHWPRMQQRSACSSCRVARITSALVETTAGHERNCCQWHRQRVCCSGYLASCIVKLFSCTLSLWVDNHLNHFMTLLYCTWPYSMGRRQRFTSPTFTPFTFPYPV